VVKSKLILNQKAVNFSEPLAHSRECCARCSYIAFFQNTDDAKAGKLTEMDVRIL